MSDKEREAFDWSKLSDDELALRFDLSAAWLLRGEHFDGPHIGVGAYLEVATRLRARLAPQAEPVAWRYKRGWEAEASDLDALLRLLGLDPTQYRTEGGNLALQRVREVLAADPKTQKRLPPGEQKAPAAGWQMVPVEPTPEMIRAYNECTWNDAGSAYSVMLSAAPKAPPAADVQEMTDGEINELTHWLDAKYRRHGEIEDKQAADMLRRMYAALRAQSKGEKE